MSEETQLTISETNAEDVIKEIQDAIVDKMTQSFNLSQLANKVNTSGQLNASTGLYNNIRFNWKLHNL